MNSAQAIMKREVSLRYWLLGREFYLALDAMEFGKKHHSGFRKDGVTPEFDHQISIAHYVRCLNLMHLEETLCVVFLHDVREDFNLADAEIRERFGDRIADAVDVMTKVFRGCKKDPFKVFHAIGENPLASIAKGADRIHNYGSMVGVFNYPKQIEYLDEGDIHFLPMLKNARRAFPQQEAAYELIKLTLKSQMGLIREVHKAAGIVPVI